MKKSLFTSAFFLFGLFTVHAQMSRFSSDTIEIRKSWGGYTFYQHGQQINMARLMDVMSKNELAFKEIRSARSSNTVSSIFGFAGGALIGWPIGSAIGGGKPNWTLAGIGAGLVAISIPFNQKVKKKAKNAVSIYNSSITSHSSKTKEIKLGLANNGIGLALKF